MSHFSQLQFIDIVSKNLPQYFNNSMVLEVGSLDINGSVRQRFSACDYTGIDVAAGKGVDIVCQGQDYEAPDNTYDHVISCECMEHNPFWVGTFRNMVRVCKPGGLVSMSLATTGRREHGTARTSPSNSPLTVALGWSYYKNLSQKDFETAFKLKELFSNYRFWVDWTTFDLYFLGIKKSDKPSIISILSTTIGEMDAYIHSKNQLKICSYRKLITPFMGGFLFELLRRIGDKYKIQILQYLHG